MRFITWNCCRKFRSKAKHIAPLRPDVLAVQEVEPFDKHPALAADPQFTFRDRLGDSTYASRAIGVFSYTPTGLLMSAVDAANPMAGFRRFRVDHPNHPFQVAATWTAVTTPRRDSYMQANIGIREHMAWIRDRDTVVLGDFNKNASYRSGKWSELQELLEQAGLVSVYHAKTGEAFGAERSRTYFHYKRDDASAQHIDYCFVPKAWVDRITHFELGTRHVWCQEGMSDHVPLIVDIDV